MIKKQFQKCSKSTIYVKLKYLTFKSDSFECFFYFVCLVLNFFFYILCECFFYCYRNI